MERELLLQNLRREDYRFTHNGEITGITSDSRKVKPGYMFIGLCGTHRDGHRFIPEAVAKGASLVVIQCREDIPPDTDFVLTEDTRLAEAVIWNNRYGNPADRMTKIGITGTAGKTSTAWMLRDILTAGGHKVGMSTTVSVTAGETLLSIPDGGSSLTDGAGAMTTPDPEYFYGAIARMRDSGCDTLLYEASSHSLVQRKTEPICPDVALFTNLTPEHMDYHGNMENYLTAKAALFRQAKLGICMAEDRWSDKLRSLVPDVPFLTCAFENRANRDTLVCCDGAAMRIRQDGGGTSFLYSGREAIFRVRMPHVGETNVRNAAMAITTALHLGVVPTTVQSAMETVRLPAGRMERLEVGEGVDFAVYIDFAHTPAALEQALCTARHFGDRLTVVFGCGGDRDKSKRPVMGKIAEMLADKVVLTSDNVRLEDGEAILADILAGMEKRQNILVEPDRRCAIRQTVLEAQTGEVILLCGKGHETWEIVGNRKYPFDERSIVREALRERTDNI